MLLPPFCREEMTMKIKMLSREILKLCLLLTMTQLLSRTLSADEDALNEPSQEEIKLLDPYRTLSQLEVERIDFLFKIVSTQEPENLERYSPPYSWGFEPKNALEFLVQNFAHVSLIPRLREIFCQTTISNNFVLAEAAFRGLLTIGTREALDAVIEALERFGYPSWWLASMRNYMNFTEPLTKKRHCIFGTATSIQEWWKKERDTWDYQPLHKATERALRVALDKSRAKDDREKALLLVDRMVRDLPLASIIPYLLRIVVDTSEHVNLRDSAIRSISFVTSDVAIPALIELLADKTPPSRPDRHSISYLAYKILLYATGLRANYRCWSYFYQSCWDRLGRKGFPLQPREIVELGIIPSPSEYQGNPANSGYEVLIKDATPQEIRRLQENWRWFWEKTKRYILCRNAGDEH